MKFDLGTQFFSGEFKIIHKDKNGNIKQELDWQKNLLLENGIKFFWGHSAIPTANGNTYNANTSSAKLDILFIGDGNSVPDVNQIKLDNVLFYHNLGSTQLNNIEIEQPSVGNHEGYVKASMTRLFTFSNFTEPKNITEIGLGCYANSDSNWTNPATRNYCLCTRALIKDTSNTPAAITVLAEEILQVYYKISCYYDIRRKTGEFTLTTIDAGNNQKTDTFEYFIQPNDITTSWFHTPFARTSFNFVDCFGVKENDDELDNTYSLNAEPYSLVNHTSNLTNTLSPVMAPNSDILTKGDNNSGGNWTYASNLNSNISNYKHIRTEIIEDDYDTKRFTKKITCGIFTHNWKNGIRGFVVESNVYAYASSKSLCKYLVIVKNKANGQGIKKLQTYEWTLEFTYSMGRWNGD